MKQILRAGIKLALIVICGLLITTIYTGYNTYKHSIESSRFAVLNRLQSIVKTLTLQLHAHEIQAILDRYPEYEQISHSGQDSLYDKVHKILKNAHDLNNVKSDIYLLSRTENDYSPGTYTYFFTVTSGDKPYFRHVYQKPPAGLQNLYEQGGAVGPFEDENGTWLSAFWPVRDAEGKTVAVLMTDRSFEVFIAEARDDMLKQLTPSFIVMGFVGLGLFLIIRSMLQRDAGRSLRLIVAHNHLRKLNTALESARENLEQKVEKRTGDLQTLNMNMEKVNREMDMFIYRASHDMKTPIHSSLNLINMIQETESEEERKRLLALMRNYSTRLLNILNDLIKFSTNNRNETLSEELDFALLIEEVKAKLLPIYSNRNILIDVSIADDLIYHGDAMRLSMVMEALLSNAIIFSDSKKDTLIKIEIKRSLNTICLSISDNGEGINNKVLPKIFDMFYRGSERSVGVGIGLYLCNEIISKLNGRIQVSSVPDKGTTFFIFLPEANVKSESAFAFKGSDQKKPLYLNPDFQRASES